MTIRFLSPEGVRQVTYVNILKKNSYSTDGRVYANTLTGRKQEGASYPNHVPEEENFAALLLTLCSAVRRILEQKQNFRNVLEMVQGGFFLRKKPLDRSDSPYTHSAFALAVPFSMAASIKIFNSALRCSESLWRVARLLA